MASLALYTHTDYFDVTEVFFQTYQRFYADHAQRKYLLVNDPSRTPAGYVPAGYDDRQPYTGRLLEALRKIDDEFVLFLHEDMFLYAPAEVAELARVERCMKDLSLDYVKLIKTGLDPLVPTKLRNLYFFPPTSTCAFAIQPTLWRVTKFIEFIERNAHHKTIWELEAKAQDSFKSLVRAMYYFREGSPKRGMFHWDSTIFPYVATAIVKGKWNLKEYPKELTELVPFDLGRRGVVE